MKNASPLSSKISLADLPLLTAVATAPNQRTFKNNRTDTQDAWDEVWYIGDATTGNEQEQNLDA